MQAQDQNNTRFIKRKKRSTSKQYGKSIKYAAPLLVFGCFAAAFLIMSDRNVEAADSLVGYWKFDESASPFADSSGNGNTGTGLGSGGTNNTPQATTTVASGFPYTNTRSLDFDGVDDYVNVVDADSLDLTTAGTISVWAKVDTLSGYSVILKKGADSFSCDTWSYGMWFVSDGSVGACTERTASIVSSNAGSIGTTSWYHIAYVWSGSSNTLYIDGSPVDSGSSVTTPTAEATNLTIGALGNGSNPYNGLFDDIRVYGRALSSTEITALANKSTPNISYDVSKFTESSANDGSISTTINITLANDTFTQSSGDFTGSGTHYTASNVPTGLTAVITAASSTAAHTDSNRYCHSTCGCQ